jgi:hypothetical protein
MTEHDVLVGFRLRLFTLADELGNVSAACRAMGVDRSSYYRWKAKVDRWGLEALMSASVGGRGCPTRSGRISSSASSPSRSGTRATGRVGSAPSWPGRSGTRSGSASTASGGSWSVGLNTRSKRLALIARHRDPYERTPAVLPPARHIDATEPGEKVQLDCFCVGRL